MKVTSLTINSDDTEYSPVSVDKPREEVLDILLQNEDNPSAPVSLEVIVKDVELPEAAFTIFTLGVLDASKVKITLVDKAGEPVKVLEVIFLYLAHNPPPPPPPQKLHK